MVSHSPSAVFCNLGSSASLYFLGDRHSLWLSPSAGLQLTWLCPCPCLQSAFALLGCQLPAVILCVHHGSSSTLQGLSPSVNARKLGTSHPELFFQLPICLDPVPKLSSVITSLSQSVILDLSSRPHFKNYIVLRLLNLQETIISEVLFSLSLIYLFEIQSHRKRVKGENLTYADSVPRYPQ